MFRVYRPLASWLPALVAAVAFVVFVAAFFYELVSYQKTVLGWAKGDINSRAHLAASNLVEPLRTQDFRALQRIGAACEADGVHLLVTTGRGGVFYDSRPTDSSDAPFYSERCPSGEYRVSIGMPRERVFAPFRRALRGFCLAALLGVAGVILFFFVTYRQRVRIRELNRLEKFRRDFIADVSHEIKTPLTGILGAVDMMSDAHADSDVLLRLIRKESLRLNGLVQSILDLARLEREGEVLHPVETNVEDLVRDVAARYGVPFSVDAKSVRVSPPVDAVASPRHKQIFLDPSLLTQALSNLVENAKRHSGSSEISLALATTDRRLEISVEDHGVGIPPADAARVFERFYRVDPSRAAETGGAGLGLAIVRRIARLHGGDVTYRPATPHGSIFTISLPF